jgi:prevent-host-death family protein
MKKYSIRELHQATGAIVRESADEPVIITDRNRPIAVIRRISEGEVPGASLPDGHWESVVRPMIEADSTEAVAADRER